MKLVTAIALVSIVALGGLTGCPKPKTDASADAAASAAASTPPPAESSTASAPTTTAHGGTAKGPEIPGENKDPNEPPSTAEHEQAANAQINKGNYKSELDKLEKEAK